MLFTITSGDCINVTADEAKFIKEWYCESCMGEYLLIFVIVYYYWFTMIDTQQVFNKYLFHLFQYSFAELILKNVLSK